MLAVPVCLQGRVAQGISRKALKRKSSLGAGNVGKKVDGGQGDEKRAKKELKYFSSLFAFSVAAP